MKDIDKAVKEAAEYEAQDKKRKEAIEVRNDADSMVFQTQKALDEAGDKLDANDKAAVEADLNALKALVEGSDAENMTDSQVDEIKAAKEKLMESARSFSLSFMKHSRQPVPEQPVQVLIWEPVLVQMPEQPVQILTVMTLLMVITRKYKV